MGRQAGTMTTEILNGNHIENMPLDFPKGIKLKTNSSVLKRMSLVVDEDDSLLQ